MLETGCRVRDAPFVPVGGGHQPRARPSASAPTRADDDERGADRDADDARHGDRPLRAAQQPHRVVEGQVGDHEPARRRLAAGRDRRRAPTAARRRAADRSRRACARSIAPRSPDRVARRAARRPRHGAPRARAGSPRQTFGMAMSGSAATAGSTVSEPSWSHSSKERVSRRRSTLRQRPPAMTSTSRWKATRRSPSPVSSGSRQRIRPVTRTGRSGRSAASSSRPTRTSAGPARRLARRGLRTGHAQRDPRRGQRDDADKRDETEDQRSGHRQPAEGSARSTTRATARANEVRRPRARRPRPAGPRRPTRRRAPPGRGRRGCVVPVAWPNGGTPPMANPVAARASSPSARRGARRAGCARELVAGRPGWRRRRGRRPGDRRP